MTKHCLDSFTYPNGQTQRNRLIVAAMTNLQSEPDGRLHQRELDWLEARAKGGFGNVTTCAAHVTLDGQGWEGELGVYDDMHIPGLTRVATALKTNGAMAWCQIFHGGVRAPSKVTGQQPWSASVFELDQTGVEIPRAATEEDIARTIDAFAQAARRCEDAGFDGVELHGAHGYLLSQFLGTITNTRTDRWGGPLEHRVRFLFEVYDAVRAITSPNFMVGIRLSPFVVAQGLELPDSLQVAQWFAERGADFIHASLWDSFQRHPDHPETSLTSLFREAVPPACPLIVTGGVWTPEQANLVLEEGADLVGMGRAAIGHADWPIRAQDPNFEPQRPPYTPEYLAEQALSPQFINYMRRWKNFVTED
ncbi:MAG TPA: oxidoreductase [Acidimicrobiaceae bacterium]|nr:oxidoreductase [Acidimicrobiaceae bacterium]